MILVLMKEGIIERHEETLDGFRRKYGNESFRRILADASRRAGASVADIDFDGTYSGDYIGLYVDIPLENNPFTIGIYYDYEQRAPQLSKFDVGLAKKIDAELLAYLDSFPPDPDQKRLGTKNFNHQQKFQYKPFRYDPIEITPATAQLVSEKLGELYRLIRMRPTKNDKRLSRWLR